jgi:hypothetical protein
MTPIDWYVRALRLFLPRDQRDDIARELAEELDAQAAEKEAALGRSLTEEERADIVAAYGHPLLTAARYRPQRFLIGPVLFPYYWLVLRVALVLLLVGYATAAVVLVAGGTDWSDLSALVARLAGNALKVAGWFTLLAAAAEMWLTRSRVLERWRPDARRHAPPHAPAERVERLARSNASPTMASLVVAVILSAWWLLGLKFPALFFGDGAEVIAFAPAVHRVYPLIVLVQILLLAGQLARLTRVELPQVFRVARLLGVIGAPLFVYFVAVTSPDWIVWTGPAGEPAYVRQVNYIVSAVLGGVAVLAGIGMLQTVTQWMARRPRGAAGVVMVLILLARPGVLDGEAAARHCCLRECADRGVAVGRRRAARRRRSPPSPAAHRGRRLHPDRRHAAPPRAARRRR